MRDPRLEDGRLKYDYLVCFSARPEGIIYWTFTAEDVGALMDDGKIKVQHAMSDTKWFFPQRSGTDAFGHHRLDYSRFKGWLESLCF